MKSLSSALVILLAAALPVFAGGASQPLERDFARPPDDARPWVFWFWSDGNITREGITADLEAMQRVGIGGVLIMEVDQGVPKGPVRMMTSEWREMFVFAASEAQRLGLKIIMNNDPGWTGSGGPWNTPENSMQKVVWTERRVSGPGKIDIELKQPQAIEGFYRDIAVLAFPVPSSETRAMRDSGPAISSNVPLPEAASAALVDGDKKSGAALVRPENRDELPYVQLGFPEPFEACAFEVSVSFPKRASGSATGRVLCELQVSDDGRAFREIARMQANATAKAFRPARAKYFRVVFSGNDASMDGLHVNEVALSSAFRVDNFERKSGLGLAASPENAPRTGAGMVVSKEKIQDLAARMRGGRLQWDAPEGEWVILRMGHTSTGKNNYPAAPDARGLEVDKLSAAALDKHFEGFLGKLVGDTEASGVGAGTLAGFHVDSWEVGYQNWTPRFRAEFERLRGYDPVPWMPAFTGRVVGDAELTERFLWDVRRTISDLLNENYAGRMAALARERGRIFSLEGYRNGPFDPLTYTGRADFPVGEFWISGDPENLHPSVKTMSSAGHVYGKNIIGAEAFTATDLQSRHRLHPYAAKSVGDAAFCAGINHFIVHRYSLQPWGDDRKPGMTMGPWGWEYERTATWWELSRPWHEYLARCQHMLRQGTFVADLCYLQDEEGIKNPPLRSEVIPAPPKGYDYDFCPGEVVLTRMSVKDGRLVLPDGVSYRMLVMPQQRLMTPALLRKIRDLVREGAVVLGAPPLRAPGLTGHPACDDEVRSLAAEIWGDCDGVRVKERAFGKGRVIWGRPPGEVLAALGAAPDFLYQKSGCGGKDGAPRVRHIHRATAEREIYFVANLDAEEADIVAKFRAGGRRPELWRPETGIVENVVAHDVDASGPCAYTRVPLKLGPRESVFVVFPKNDTPRSDKTVAAAGGCVASGESAAAARTDAEPDRPAGITGEFTLAAWIKPAADMDVPVEDFGGTSALRITRNDLIYPPQGVETFHDANAAGVGIAAGRNVICVLEHSAFHFTATLVHPFSITDWTHVAVVYRDGRPHLYINAQPVRTGLKSLFDVRGFIPAARNSVSEEFKGGKSSVQLIARALNEAGIRELMRENPVPQPATPGSDVAKNTGAERSGTVPNSAPAGLALDGPWTLDFPAGWGAPPTVELPRLMSWIEHATPGVRYFSGTAVYTKTFVAPSGMRGENRRLWLDLGEVREIAQVRLNGRDVGILWKPPFRADITGVLRDGSNTLEVAVTNTWVNRLIGDEQLPLDREWVRVPRRRGFALKEYPGWFLRGERSPAGRFTFTTWKHYEKDAPLLPSGLIGPVVIRTLVKTAAQEP